MAADELKSNEGAAQEVSSSVTEALDGYCTLKMESISGLANVSAGGMHDGFAGSIEEALSNWRDMMNGEALAIVSTGLMFARMDSALSREINAINGMPIDNQSQRTSSLSEANAAVEEAAKNTANATALLGIG